MGYGYFGKVLVVDLSSGDLEEKRLPDEVYKDFLGGYGLGAKVIYDWTKKGYNPLSPDAVLGIVPGLITGTVAPFSGRYMTCGKSPLTGGWGDANSGGFFGPAVKHAGFDGIFLKGVAESPKYLLVSNDELSLKDASALWGLDTIEVDTKLQELHGRNTKVASIGEAGERVSLISGVVNDKGRIAARSGLGAVMGAKKLKAIAISKNGSVPIKDKEALLEITKKYNNLLNEKPGFVPKMIAGLAPKMGKLLRWTNLSLSGQGDGDGGRRILLETYRKFGTSSLNSLGPEIGDSPVKNWGGIGYIDFPMVDAEKISGYSFLEYKVRKYGCAMCPVQCGAILSVPDLGLKETHRPEYETSCMFGSLSLNSDVSSILLLNEMCNRAGIDSISTGSVVAFAIECFENGLLTTADTGGLELHWGDSKAILKLTEMIIKREGIGDVLADGVERAAARIGKGSERYAMHAGGEALPAHDPKLAPSLALTYVSDPTPGRHTAASIDFMELGAVKDFIPGLNIPKNHKKDPVQGAEAQRTVVCLSQDVSALGFCTFSTMFGAFPLLEIVEATTGWKWTPEDAMKIGLRIQTQRLAFSLREGVNPLKKSLPGRAWGEIPHEKGPHKGKTLDYKQKVRFYYERMGWDPETGIPSKASLDAVGLGSLYVDLI